MAENGLTTEVFTDAVKPLTDFLEHTFKDGLCVSDLRDDLGKQYVDLVQEGGGVHGIALAGYTYILEKMNIGFMKMAGTSAGSINTLLLNAVYTHDEAELLRQKEQLKNDVPYYHTRSEKVLEYLSNKNLGDLIDGHPSWRKLILSLFSPPPGSSGFKGSVKAIKNAAILSAIFFITFLICSLCLAFYTTENSLLQFFRWASVLAAVGLILVLTFFLSRIVMAKLLYKHAEKFGINPGKNFEDWITQILLENGIESVDDLNDKLDKEQRVLRPHYQPCVAKKPELAPAEEKIKTIGNDELIKQIQDPKVKVETLFDELNRLLIPSKTEEKKMAEHLSTVISAFEQRLFNDEHPTVTKELVIVSSDITHQLKVEFPGMHKMYWGNDYGISPAKYVRASMSVPIFFKPFQVRFNKGQMLTIQQEWAKVLRTQKNLEESALFVDGGLLSNFPINVFYNPSMPVPRKPTFGIKLEYEDESAAANIRSLSGFAGSLISTMRYFYDRDFALKHDIYQKTVRSIDTGKVHWLNFNLSDQDKIELFFRGALTATIFLARHAITEHETQKLLKMGNEVTYAGKKFSIYPDGETSFRTEDCLIGDITFEWQEYKRERLLDRITKEDRKEQIKAEAALKDMPKTLTGKNT